MLTKEEATTVKGFLLEIDEEITVMNDMGMPTSGLTNPLDHAMEYIDSITEED